jgi:hypothetical protein
MTAGSFNVLRKAYSTLCADLRCYQPKGQPLSPHRLLRALSPNLKRPLFIVGAPRSGTSLVAECLSELAEISYHHEPVATKAAARYVFEEAWSFAWARFFYRQAYGWLMRIHLDGHLRFAEKTPRNCFLMPFLHRIFPDAQFLHVIRDGRDAALSHSKTPWLQAASASSGIREPGGYPFGPAARFWVERERVIEFETTSDIHRCAWAWRRHVESALEAGASLPAGQYHEVRYEALANHSDEEVEHLLDFAGISVPTSRKRFRQAADRAHADSVGRWRRELSTEQLAQIDAEAGQLLQQLGYKQQ